MNVKAFSGKKNEKDVAFHLKRAFLDRSDVEVFNDLRIVVDGESAQIDHLILHKYGFIIVESKSVKDYTECPKCHTNTAMKSDCSACGSKKTKVSKSKHTYVLECQDCQGVSKITVDSEMRVMSQ